jgi:1,2-phenylacetyl-CoA epoxidase catalytic subunit
MSAQHDEIHRRDHAGFLDEVHSFEFWFQAVEGYLHENPYGYPPDLEEPALASEEKEALKLTLYTYCVGETAALEGASGMIAFAPNRQAKIFLATQVVDEARHLEVFLRRLRDLGVEAPESQIEQQGNRSLLEFKRRLLEFVAARDWEGAVFAQNVILESMEFTTFASHMRRSDAKTAAILAGVVKDERRHLGFGENDLGRRLAASPHTRVRLARIKQELDRLVLDTFEESLEAMHVPRSERPDLGRDYLEIVARLGVHDG